jgi:DNA polymerase (family 10)
MEVDILADGSLDLADEMLSALDIVLVSVHSKLDLPADEQTARILQAVQHPSVHILAHPTGRVLNRREPMQFDLDEVLHCAADHDVVVELNAHPDRLDLRDTHLMRAKELGLKISLGTDAHRVSDLGLMHYGIDQARRAWLTKEDVVNAWGVERVLGWLRTKTT